MADRMTTRNDITVTIGNAKTRVADLSKKIAADSRSYLADHIRQGPRACLDALAQDDLLLTPQDRAVLRDEVGASLAPHRERGRGSRSKPSAVRSRLRIGSIVRFSAVAAIVLTPIWISLALAWHNTPAGTLASWN